MHKISFKKVQAGDVFCFYMGKGVYGFARLVYFSYDFIYVFEIFDHKSDSFSYNEEIVLSSRLFPLLSLNLHDLMHKKRWSWKVIYRDNNFLVPINEIEKLELKSGPSQFMKINTLWKEGGDQMRYTRGYATKEYVSKLEDRDLELNTEWLYIRILKKWKLIKKWKNPKEMWQWFFDEGVYKTRF